MFGIALKPYDRGRAAFKRGAPSTKNPFPDHDPPRNDDSRWYQWRQGWRRAELDAVIAEKGTCAGEHARNDIEGKICDIGGVGWTSLDPGTSGARLGWTPIRCATCGEIWSMDWGGYDHETDMEEARDAGLGHSFPRAAVKCAQCGMRDSDAKDTPCPNRAGEGAVTEWLEASRAKKDAERALADAAGAFDRADKAVSARPCPNMAGSACDPACPVCEGRGTMGIG